MKTLSVAKLLGKKYTYFDLSDPWKEFIDSPETTGVWLVWGMSGSGKTTFVLQLIKELATTQKVLFNSLEEGVKGSLQKKARHVGLMEANSTLRITKCTIEELIYLLDKPRSAPIVVIDSFQALKINYKDYLDLKDRYPNKLIIFISQAIGRLPKCKPSMGVMYDADMKIHVEGFRATSHGRYIGKKGSHSIWKERETEYWAKKL